MALAARVNAATRDDQLAMAVRFANALTGADAEAARVAALDDGGDADEDRSEPGDDDVDDGDDNEDDDSGCDEARNTDRPGDDDFDRAGRETRPRLDPQTAEARSEELRGVCSDDDPAHELIAGSSGDDDSDAGDFAPTSMAADDGDQEAAGAGEVSSNALAVLDAELDPGDAMARIDAGAAAATAGAAEVYEQWMRHQRPSPWGRLDFSVALRRRWSEPMHAPANRYDEIWLVATWRR